MMMIDCISRLVPGVLNNDVSAEFESFHDNLLEYPQYSRPEEFMGRKVPEILLSGHHANIEKWRQGAVHYPDPGTEAGAFGGCGALQKGKALPGGAFEKKGGKPGRRYDLVLAIWTDICYNHKP